MASISRRSSSRSRVPLSASTANQLRRLISSSIPTTRVRSWLKRRGGRGADRATARASSGVSRTAAQPIGAISATQLPARIMGSWSRNAAPHRDTIERASNRVHIKPPASLAKPFRGPEFWGSTQTVSSDAAPGTEEPPRRPSSAALAGSMQGRRSVETGPVWIGNAGSER